MTDGGPPGIDQPGLELVGVHAGYGDTNVLRGVDLAVARGELLVVLGRSGAGKSTLLRVVAGLEPATRGRVRITGRDVTRLRPGRRDVSMVFQSYALFPHLTVADNIGFGLTVRDVPKAEARERIRKAAEAVGCEHLLARRPGQLSGGERQRVALARALVREPDVFLLDEPLSNLDAELRVRTRTELRALHDRVGTTMLHVTHDQTEALVLGDRVAVLRDGRIEQVGTPEEIWRRPATSFVARFVGSPSMNLLPANGPLPVPGVPPSATRQVGVRPEAVRLDDPQGVMATVERVEVVGEDAYLYLRLDGHEIVARVATVGRPESGALVRVTVRPVDAHVFEAATGQRVTEP
ncbi:MAG TPA: ABC transporter ATP-binding protein [Micromonosporaceae bacterium]